jgi:hypothetical protein
LQEEFNLPVEKIKFQKELAALLPDPLYILYSQIKAFIEACGKRIITIVFLLKIPCLTLFIIFLLSRSNNADIN